MSRWFVLAALLVISCKKDPPAAGMPPADEWKATAPAATPPAPTPPAHGGPVAAPSGARTLDKQGDLSVLGPFSVAIPKEWTEKPVTSNMRAAHFTFGDAELVVYYFGEGGAGGIDANLDRWLGQFQQADGKPSKDVAKIEKTKFAGQETTVVSVSGRYVTTTMPGGGDPIDKAEQAMLAAIVESPKGPYYFKLVGGKQTIADHTPRFRAMLGSLKLR